MQPVHTAEGTKIKQIGVVVHRPTAGLHVPRRCRHAVGGERCETDIHTDSNQNSCSASCIYMMLTVLVLIPLVVMVMRILMVTTVAMVGLVQLVQT